MGLKFRKEYRVLVSCTLLISIRQLHRLCYGRNYILLFAMLLISFQAKSQSEEILLQLMNKEPKERHDSLYYELFKLTKTSNQQKANHYSQLAYQLSGGYNHFLLQTKVCYALAYMHDDVTNQPDSSSMYYHKAIQIASSHNLKDWLVNLYNDLGLHHQRLDVYDSAIHYFLLTFNLASENQSYQSLSITSQNIGLVNSYLENYTEAIYYFNKAIAIKNEHQITRGLEINYLNLARVYSEQGDYNNAIAQLKKVESICTSGCDDNTLAGLNYSLGYANFKRGNEEKSYTLFSKALAFARKGGNKQWLSNTLFQLSYFSIANKDYNEALCYLQEAEMIATEINHRRLLRNIYEQYSIVYDNTGDVDQAHYYEKLFIQLKDNIFNKTVANNILREHRMQSDAIIHEKETELWESYIVTSLLGLNFILLCVAVYMVFKASLIKTDILQLMSKRILKK